MYNICKEANDSNEPPIKALFGAYEAALNERGSDFTLDLKWYPYISLVSNAAKEAGKGRHPVNLVQVLKSVLQSYNITLVEPDDGEDESVVVDAAPARAMGHQIETKLRRRVSFDDARNQETWLSERADTINLSPVRPSRNSRAALLGRRARSTSVQRQSENEQGDARASSDRRLSNVNDQYFTHPGLLEQTQTELDLKVDVFQTTSTLNSARQALSSWRTNASLLRRSRSLNHAIASSYDRRTLLRQAFDAWRVKLVDVVSIKHKQLLEEQKFIQYDKRAVRVRNLMLLRKCFTHWAFQTEDERLRTAVAHRHLLRFTYFNRWRAIATENQAKARSILSRKYLAIWRRKTARSQLQGEQAAAHYEENLIRKCKSQWFWEFCSRQVEGWHEQWVHRRTLGRLAEQLNARQLRERKADEINRTHTVRRSFGLLVSQAQTAQANTTKAIEHFHRTWKLKSLESLHASAILAPVARNLKANTARRDAGKALRVWHLHASLSQQATAVDRRRILRTAWTNWNDSLRCRALGQKIDERLLVQHLYRWVLKERLELFTRASETKILDRVFGWWRGKVHNERNYLAEAEAVFAERQRRRRLAMGMLRLNSTMRSREDADRAANEFFMSRALPKTMETWRARTEHILRLGKWALDARFYCLCSGSIKLWKSKTNEQIAHRKRDAYTRIRARIKIRLARDCLSKIRASTSHVLSLDAEAEQRRRVKAEKVSVVAFDQWRSQTSQYSECARQAIELDQQKLLSSALAALHLRHTELLSMDDEAQRHYNESELGLLASALRRMQWATFTTKRKVESAEALWNRNRDQHIKQMIRHWAATMATRRSAALHEAQIIAQDDEDPESPSIRPASRAATRSTFLDSELASSPPVVNHLQSTPGYMRTPTRPRRTGRFRPIPTPAAFTPLAFDPAYMTTTPAPLPIGEGPTLRQAQDRSTGEGLTPQITPFSRKLRAGGVLSAGFGQSSALRRVEFGRSVQDGTGKSVRFARGSRFPPVGRERGEDS